jgi:dTMP kinase
MRSLNGNHSNGLFIVLEGIDGSGSTTQGERLNAWLRHKGFSTHFTHEPSGGPAGMLIRLALSKRLLGPNYDYQDPSEDSSSRGTALDAHTLALLYAADRMDHLATEVLPNLARSRIVICDRYVLSTLAYQGLSVGEEWLLSLNQYAHPPDLTIYLDVAVEHARHRMRRTRWTKDLFEDEDQLRAIRERYLQVIRTGYSQLGRIVQVDASLPVENVGKRIRALVEEILPTNTGDAEPATPSLFAGEGW